MTTPIALVWLGSHEKAPPWRHGSVTIAGLTPGGVATALGHILTGKDPPEWILFWAPSAGNVPNAEVLGRLLGQPGDVAHAGLALGMGGLPGLIDFVAPTWMLNRDPDSKIEATSWRLSLAACLIRTDTLRQLGGIETAFVSLTGAGLELGHRLVCRGAFVRHVPSLLQAGAAASRHLDLPLVDELRFVVLCFGLRWMRWAIMRAVLSGAVGAAEAISAARRLAKLERPDPLPAFQRPRSETASTPQAGVVTVLIPTIDRYPYLLKLLEQLRQQTIAPREILVMDQTPLDRRMTELESRFPGLPLRVIILDRAGQCSSRNAGLETAIGDCLLFLDDDEEVPADLIEKHVKNLGRFESGVSSGVAIEDGAGPLPESFTFMRQSDVFPAGNSLVRRSALARSGLFDLAFDHGARADHDLGMRLYLSGAFMVMDPDISVLHHHAPRGGLRTHGARVVTYMTSRNRLTHRTVPAVSEIYLARRYFTDRQVREALWIAVLGTFSIRGGRARRFLKLVVSALLLPDTLLTLRTRMLASCRMLSEYPQIPAFPERPTARIGS